MGDTFGLSGAMQGAGNVGAAGINAAAQAETNKTNMEIATQAGERNTASAREAMAFSERMSNTQYQRGMEDMRQAGLNPMLAFMKGGADAPSGVSANQPTATMQAPEYGKMAEAFGASAKETMQTRMALQEQKKNNELLDKAVQLKEKDIDVSTATAKGIELNNQQKQAEMPAIIKHAKINEQAAATDAVGKRLGGWVGGPVSAAGLAVTQGLQELRKKTDEAADYAIEEFNRKYGKKYEEKDEKGFKYKGKRYQNIERYQP